MELVRLVVITAEPDVIAHFRGKGLEWSSGTVIFRTSGWTDDNQWVLVASIALQSPMPHIDGTIDFHRPELEDLDGALHWLADTLTLARGQPFRIIATSRSLGLLGSDDELEPLNGLDLKMRPAKFAFRTHDPIELAEFAALSDRADGVALLAEAISHGNALGKYSQLVRFLERAFGRGSGKFDFELQNFLAGNATRHWFAKSEIADWIARRPGALHADVRTRPIWFQRHVELVVSRLQEAAIDVLFNKVNWNSADFERRQLRVPRQGSLDAEGGWFVTIDGSDSSAQIQMFDPVGSFRMDFRSLDSATPGGLWATAEGETLILRFAGDPGGAVLAGSATSAPVPAVLLAGKPLVVYAADDDSIRSPE